MRVRKDFKRKEGVRSARLVVIAAEGRKTENIYFEAMKDSLCASAVHLEVLHRDSDISNPEEVYNQIRNFMDEYSIEEDDELWVVIDKDKWKVKMLASVAQFCAQNNNLRFCVSNPCFELWLLLHIEDISKYDEAQIKDITENKKVSKSRTWLKRCLKDSLGSYNESKYDPNLFLPHIDNAISRAEELDINPSDRWPQTIGTRVYLLARSIMDLK